MEKNSSDNNTNSMDPPHWKILSKKREQNRKMRFCQATMFYENQKLTSFIWSSKLIPSPLFSFRVTLLMISIENTVVFSDINRMLKSFSNLTTGPLHHVLLRCHEPYDTWVHWHSLFLAFNLIFVIRILHLFNFASVRLTFAI